MVHGMSPDKSDALVEGINNFLVRIAELEAAQAAESAQ